MNRKTFAAACVAALALGATTPSAEAGLNIQFGGTTRVVTRTVAVPVPVPVNRRVPTSRLATPTAYGAVAGRSSLGYGGAGYGTVGYGSAGYGSNLGNARCGTGLGPIGRGHDDFDFLEGRRMKRRALRRRAAVHHHHGSRGPTRVIVIGR